MSKTPRQPTRHDDRTGTIAPIEDGARREPPPPPTLPEMADHDASTGVTRVVTEGADRRAARDADRAKKSD